MTSGGVADVTPPEIKVDASATVPIGTNVNKQYLIDNASLSVIDDTDGDITATSKVTVSTISTTTANTGIKQTITAKDAKNNESTEEITVIVEEEEAPAAEQQIQKINEAKGRK